MKRIAQNTITGLLLSSAFLAVQAQAEIQTSVVQGHYQITDVMKSFSKNTPCFITFAKERPENYARVVQIFKDAGFNIIDDKSAKCSIMFVSEITYDTGSGQKSFYPGDVLKGKMSWPDTMVNPNPTIVAKTNAARAAIENAKKPSMTADGINILTQTGGMIGGSAGASMLGGAGVVLNLLSGFIATPSTPVGMASTTAYLAYGNFFKDDQITTKIYAASDTPQTPEDLFYASIKRTAEAMEAAIYECHIKHNLPFDMPIPTPENSKIRPPAPSKATAADAQATIEKD